MVPARTPGLLDEWIVSWRRRHCGVAEKKGLWEIHYDPYDVSRVWVRDRRSEAARWITVFGEHLHRVGVPLRLVDGYEASVSYRMLRHYVRQYCPPRRNAAKGSPRSTQGRFQ
ncbi:hypothetical protein ABZX93_32175 [Streptomyces sp. NPDC006632]|uniref:hypothetical protein n=1 Tax=Streptomyces sp. NPDC006632 TaxID=3157182 RepID=UPI0033AE03C5